MVENGIVDPPRWCAALQDAASVAGLIVTAEAMVAERPKETRQCRPCRRRRDGGMVGWWMGGMDF